METDEALNAQEAAELLGAHVETIRRLARRGLIPAYKIGKDWRFRKTALLSWSETNPAIRKEVGILVVDDDPRVCRLIQKVLIPAGCRVVTATSGIDGLNLVHREFIDLVLLDLEMPIMNGPAFIGELRKAGLDIPVIIITGYPDNALMMQACRFGPLMLIPKPIEKEMLLAAVRRALPVAAVDTAARQTACKGNVP